MDIRKNSLPKKGILIFFIILITAFVLRIYNLNFEDYWFDEQASFWVANPVLSFNETVERGKELDGGIGIIFNFILKNFFSIFDYSPNIGRYLPFIFGVLSIPALCYLTFQIKKDESYLLVGILSSINFYLISYSQEVRVYSLLFFVSILSLILFFKLFENEYGGKKNYLYATFYTLISLFGTCLHIFFFIIIISQLFFLFLNLIFNERKLFFSLLFVLAVPLLYVILMHEYLLSQINIKDFWIQQVNLDFFYNFFFSRFFGSKIMGIIYLLSLIYLIFTNRKRLFDFKEKNFLLILIIFFSYFLPLLYSVFRQPILIDRYIIFVLIPIFILIAVLALDIKSLRKRYFILTVILVSSLINNYIEIFNREKTKPEFNKVVKYISESNFTYTVTKSNTKTIETIIINYAKNISLKKTNNIKFLHSNFDYSKLNEIWLLCYKPVNGSDCSAEPYSFSTWSKIDNVDYKLINAKLFKK